MIPTLGPSGPPRDRAARPGSYRGQPDRRARARAQDPARARSRAASTTGGRPRPRPPVRGRAGQRQPWGWSTSNRASCSERIVRPEGTSKASATCRVRIPCTWRAPATALLRLHAGSKISSRSGVTRELGEDADNVRLDPRTGQVVVGYGDGALALVDAASGTKTGAIALADHPEVAPAPSSWPRLGFS